MELVCVDQEQTCEQTREQMLKAKQVELEQLYSKNQLIPRIRAEFQKTDTNFAEYMLQEGIPLNFGWDLLVQMALHKRADLPTMVGLLYHHFGEAQLTADMLHKATGADLVDWDATATVFITKFNVSDEVQRELDMFQFPLPMVVEPRTIRNNHSSGYLLYQGSVILKDNHHDDDVCLEHLNLCNSIPLSINVECVLMIHNKWKNLDKAKEGETFDDFQQRKRAFAKYDRTARDVINTLTEHGNEFYLTHKYDKRGRTYCMGYHVSYQSASWNKATVEFSRKELVT